MEGFRYSAFFVVFLAAVVFFAVVFLAAAVFFPAVFLVPAVFFAVDAVFFAAVFFTGFSSPPSSGAEASAFFLYPPRLSSGRKLEH